MNLKIFSDDLSLRDQIFRLVIVTGMVLSLGGGIGTAILGHKKAVIAMAIGMVLFAACGVLTFRFGKARLCQHLVMIVTSLVILPIIFWSFGGAERLTVIWIVMVLFYMFHMFSGVALAIYFSMVAILYAIMFYGSYLHPEFVDIDLGRGVALVYLYVSLMGVGVFIGAILWLQVRLFDKERARYEEQAESLRESRDLKSELYTNLSHEIRTPINTIIGANEIILRNETIDASTRDVAQKIGAAAERLNTMVSDILDISQLENGSFELESTTYNTVDFFRELLEVIKLPCEEKELQLYLNMNFEVPSQIRGDERRVRQILMNILSNAVKYTESGSITIDVQGLPKNDTEMELKVSVADTGEGIRKEELDSIFSSFRRSRDANEGKFGGAGIGLSIAKQLAVLMGGDILVDSIFKKGSIFTVSITQEIVDGTPVGEVNWESNKPREVYQSSFEAPRARVLVVDDNEVNGIITRSLLEPTKMQVDIAQSGVECLMLTKEKYYDVILMDFLMPRLNGVETYKELRKQENGLCRDSAVIILTANMEATAKTICQENGFDGYMEKPLYGATLEREIVKFLPKEIVEFRAVEYAERAGNMADIAGKKRKKIYITADCTCDLTREIVERYDIRIMYMNIHTPNGNFIDTKEIDSSALSLYLEREADDPVRPTAPSVSAFEKFFAEALAQAEEVIHISMAGYAGDTYSHAVEAAKGFSRVHVIDSGQISSGTGILVQRAARMAIEGFDSDRIVQTILTERNKVRCFVFTPSVRAFMTRDYIGKTSGKLLSALRLCPTIEIKNSKPGIGEVTFGMPYVAQKRFLMKHLRRKRRINDEILMISYVNKSAKEREEIQGIIRKQMSFRRIVMQRACFSTGCSAGDGALCIAYLEK